MTTVVTMVVDESGSMAGLVDSTINGFNEYVATLKVRLSEDPVYFSSILFDTRGIRKLQVGAPIFEAILLSRTNYSPTGGTPLFDAIGKAIIATDEVAGKNLADKAIIVIQTDGEENSSHEFSLEKIKVMIEERQAKGWEFVFIGAGIDAYKQGSQMGFTAQNTMSYEASTHGTRSTFAAMASNSVNYASGIASNMAFSSLQKKAVGDKYVDELDLTSKV